MKIKEKLEYQRRDRLVSLSPKDTVRDAVNLMTERNIGSVIIVNKDDTVAGIVTERDLMKRVLFENKNPDKTLLSDIMTKDIHMAKEEDNLVDWLRTMSNERFRHLPVVDDNKKIIGVMSQGDFVSYTWPELLDRVKENTKASFASGSQVFLIVLALLAYALIVQLFL